MATNTYKSKDKHRGRTIFSFVEQFFKIDENIKEVIHVRYLSQIIFISLICLIYIGNRHYAEKTVRNIGLLEQQVEDLRADYTTLKSDYMFASKQSEIAKKVAKFALFESRFPPQKILMTK